MKFHKVGVARLVTAAIAEPDMLRGIHLSQITDWLDQWVVPNHFYPRAVFKTLDKPAAETVGVELGSLLAAKFSENNSFMESQTLHKCGLVSIENYIDEEFQKFLRLIQKELRINPAIDCTVTEADDSRSVFELTFEFNYEASGGTQFAQYVLKGDGTLA